MAEPTTPPAGLTWPWLTTERGLYIGAFLAAAFLRFAALGTRPLDNSEAALATQAWRALRGEPVDLLAEPLLVYGDALVFLLFGANDTTARLLPALAGTLAVVMPYFLRAHLGRLPAIVTAYYLALSPSFVFFSGTADSAMVAVALLLALIVLLVRTDLTWRLYLVGLATGLLLVSGPLGCAALAMVACGVAATLAATRNGPAGEVVAALADVRDGAFWRRAGPVTLVTYGAVSTGLGANPRGFQAGLPDGLGIWLGEFGFGTRTVALLLAYEPLVVLLAIAALGWMAVRRHPAGNLLAGWVALTLVIAVLTGSTHRGMLLLVALPLGLLVSLLAAYTLERLQDGGFRRTFGLFLVGLGPWLFLLLYLWPGHFSRPGADAMRVLGTTPPWVLLVPIGLAALFVLTLAAYRVGYTRTGQCLALTSALLWAMFSLHTSFNTIQPNLEAPAQLLFPRPISPDVRTMAAELHQTIDALTYLPSGRQVQVEERFRLPLAWYLREVPDLVFVSRANEGAALAIVSVDSPPPSPKYRARRYQLAFEMQGQPLRSGADRFWRWFMYREPLASPRSEGVLLLVRGRW